MRRFSLCIENLEPRRLMDASGAPCIVGEDATSEIVATVFDSANDHTGAPELVEVGEYQTLGFSTDIADNLSIASYQPANVFRSGSTVVAIAGSNYSGTQKLWVIHEGGESGGEIAFDLDLGQFWVEHVLIDGNHLLVVGENWEDFSVNAAALNDAENNMAAFPSKRIIAIDLNAGAIVKEFELPAGFVKYADFSEGQATIIVQRTDLITPAIWPPVETNDDVYRFTWNQDGLGDLRMDHIPTGQVTVVGDRVFVAVEVYGDLIEDLFDGNIKVETELRMFLLTPDGVEAKGGLKIDRSFISGLQVSASGERAAVAILSTDIALTLDPARWPLSVLILDLTGVNGPVIEETIDIPQPSLPLYDGSKSNNDDPFRPIIWYQPQDLLYQSQDYFVFRDAYSGTMTIVDLDSDVASEDRVTTVNLPDDVQVSHDTIRFDDDRLVFVTGDPYWAFPFFAPSFDRLSMPYPQSRSNGLLTVSLNDNTMSFQSFGDDVWLSNITLIDAEEGRIGFQTNSRSTIDHKFVFGTFDEENAFFVEGEIASDSYAASFNPHQDSITVATERGLSTYSYDNPDEPLYVIRFVDENVPSLQAIDDAIKLYPSLPEPSEVIQSVWIDLLANDQIPYYSQFTARIVELIDAPEGVNLEDGRYVWLDSRIQSLEEPLAFKYKVSDEWDESIAEVEITLAEVTEDQRTAMIDAIKSAVSRDFGLSIEDISVEAAAYTVRQNEDSMPEIISMLLLEDSFTFEVTAPGFRAYYGSDLAANVSLITVLEREDENEASEPIVELSVAATNDEGNDVQFVKAGESFWLELRGKALRATSHGVFSAFLNLTVPDSLGFEGTVEAGEGFSFVDVRNIAEKVTAQSITSLGVFDADGTPPVLVDDMFQVLIRVRVTANEIGAVTLVAGPSPRASEETTVFGANEAIPERLIMRTPFVLVIGEREPTDELTDVDGDGSVLPLDALRVLNIVSRYGVGTIDEIKARMEAARDENTLDGSAAQELTTQHIRRFDVNRNGSITPLDALLVINQISRQNRRTIVPGESAALTNNLEALTVDPTHEEQERKRRR